MLKKTKNIISTFLFVIFVLIIVNNSLYQHSHILKDGSVITHAHYFDKSTDDAPNKEHKHSLLEFFAINGLVHFLIFSFIFVFININTKILFYRCINSFYALKTISSQQNRAPPVLFVSF